MEIFSYSSPHDYLARLNRQYNMSNNDPMDIDKALDFCLTAWSMSDWVYHWKHPKKEMSLGDFRKKELFQKCSELIYMHDIANGTKHFDLEKPKSPNEIASLESAHSTAFSSDFSSDFDSPSLNVRFSNGDWLILSFLMDEVHRFWNDYLSIQ